MRKTCARLSCRRPPSCPNRHRCSSSDRELPGAEPSPTFQRNTRAISLAFSIGFSLAGPVILGALAGYWLDGRFGTSPTWTMILTILGMGAGLAQMIRVVNKLNQLEDKR
jgi:F0F1-type ATP synthase assembly protein I